jgi:hypothetical protein
MLETDGDLWGASPVEVLDMILATLAERALRSFPSPGPLGGANGEAIVESQARCCKPALLRALLGKTAGRRYLVRSVVSELERDGGDVPRQQLGRDGLLGSDG